MKQTIKIPQSVKIPGVNIPYKIPYRFITTIVIFVVLVTGFVMGSKLKEFENVDFGAINIGLLLANSVLLLIMFGILVHIRNEFFKKEG